MFREMQGNPLPLQFVRGYELTFQVNIISIIVIGFVLSGATTHWREICVILSGFVCSALFLGVLITHYLLAGSASKMQTGVLFSQSLFLASSFIAIGLYRLDVVN